MRSQPRKKVTTARVINGALLQGVLLLAAVLVYVLGGLPFFTP